MFPSPDPLRLLPPPWVLPFFSLAPPPDPPSALSASPRLPLSFFRLFPPSSASFLPSGLSAALRASGQYPSPARDAASTSQFPLPHRPSSRPSFPARPGRAAILCEFLTAAGAGQPGHPGRADRQTVGRSPPPVSLPKIFFFFFSKPSLALLFPLPSRLLHRAGPALITPNHPPVSVSPGSPTPGPAGVRVWGGSRPDEGSAPVSE